MPDSPRRGSLLVIFLTVFIDLLGFGMVLPLLPIYAKDFAGQLGLQQGDPKIGLLIGMLMSSFSLMQFLFSPLWGKLSDRIGRRPVLLVGLAGSTTFYFLFGLATFFQGLAGLVLLFASRIGAGISGATISTAQAYIADSTALENRAKGMALIGAAFGLGFTLGPLFGFFALPSGTGGAGPGPGFAAAALSATAFGLAYTMLPESLRTGSKTAARRWIDFDVLRGSLGNPAIPLLLLAMFVCIFSFANFESTLSLLLNDERRLYRFTFAHVCLTFAYIGVILTLVQGGIVRRLAGRVSEGAMATAGAVVEIAGFILLADAARGSSLTWLLISLAVVVSGFALLTPSLNSLLSRWSDPARQGGILGVGQSISALARILGPLIGVTLYEDEALAQRLGVASPILPLGLAALLMGLGLLLVIIATLRGRDFPAGNNSGAAPAPIDTI